VGLCPGSAVDETWDGNSHLDCPPCARADSGFRQQVSLLDETQSETDGRPCSELDRSPDL